MSFIRYHNPRLPEMSRLASLRSLTCERLTGELAQVQIYKVSSHSLPGQWRIVELHADEAKCSCPSVEACTHIAIALSDLHPRFISEWQSAQRDDLCAELAGMRGGSFRAGARKAISDYREKRRAMLEPVEVETVGTPF